jgi:GAF domain-containing protein
MKDSNQEGARFGYDPAGPRPTRPIYRAAHHTQSVSDLAETLKQIMVNALALLGARHCWITGVDLASNQLISIAALSQDAPESSRVRAPMQQRVAGWVTANRAPALINDVSSDPRCQGSGAPVRGSMLCVPLLSGEQLLGAITVSSPSPRMFNQQALRMLQALADQAILAISRARQAEASHRQAQQLAAFLDVARAMTSMMGTPQILRAIVAMLRRLVPCDEAVIFGYVEEAQELRAVARLGAHDTQLEKLRIPASDKQSVAAWVAQKRRPILHAPGGRVFVGRVTEELLGEDDLALLGVPLLSRDQLRGVVILARSTPFDTSELRAMLNMSNIVAVAMDYQLSGAMPRSS